MTTVSLQLCGTCRRKGKGAQPCTPLHPMMAAANAWAKRHGRELVVSPVSCLSGCAIGATAMVETADASVRLHSVATPEVLNLVLDQLDSLLAGTAEPPVRDLVLSRTDWTLWR
jgi:predicted metal-binding protein